MNDLEIFRGAASALRTGGNIALVTVISTAGSTPGKVGYKMLVSAETGETTGTVGGGLTEAQMIEIAKSMLPEAKSQVFRFDFGGTQEDEKGICGGSAEFLVETFDKKSLPLFEELSTAIINGEKGALISIISPGKSPEKIFLKDTDRIDTAISIKLSQEVITSIKELAAKEQPAKKVSGHGFKVFVETIAKQPPLIIFGAGHLSCHISRYAKSLHFTVTVCDDRVQYANKERFPDADYIIIESFERAFDKIHIDSDSYIVIVTRGHKFDQMILEQALRTNAKYIGMIGSKRKTLTILKKLNEMGIPEETLNRVYSPIGVSIGAVTPEEIALSIICELVKIRRIGHGSNVGHMTVPLSKRLHEEDEEDL
jgi:xanthine dehydrogenase accessory factor